MTRAGLDKQPHDEAAMFDRVALGLRNLTGGIVALHRAIRPA